MPRLVVVRAEKEEDAGKASPKWSVPVSADRKIRLYSVGKQPLFLNGKTNRFGRRLCESVLGIMKSATPRRRLCNDMIYPRRLQVTGRTFASAA